MAVFESTHPLGQNMETIFGALNAGITSESGIFPDHIKVDYVDPFEGDGVGKLRIADWKTENRANIYFPVAVDAG